MTGFRCSLVYLIGFVFLFFCKLQHEGGGYWIVFWGVLAAGSGVGRKHKENENSNAIPLLVKPLLLITVIRIVYITGLITLSLDPVT